MNSLQDQDCPLRRLPLEIRRMIYHDLWDDDKNPTMGAIRHLPALASAFLQLKEECCAVFFETCRLDVTIDIDQRVPRARLARCDFVENFTRLTRHNFVKSLPPLAGQGLLENRPRLQLSRHGRRLGVIRYPQPGHALESVRKIGITFNVPQIELRTEAKLRKPMCSLKIDLARDGSPENCVVSLDRCRWVVIGTRRVRRPILPCHWAGEDPHPKSVRSIKGRLETVLAKQKRPLRWSEDLLMSLTAAIADLQRSLFGPDHQVRHYVG